MIGVQEGQGGWYAAKVGPVTTPQFENVRIQLLFPAMTRPIFMGVGACACWRKVIHSKKTCQVSLRTEDTSTKILIVSISAKTLCKYTRLRKHHRHGSIGPKSLQKKLDTISLLSLAFGSAAKSRRRQTALLNRLKQKQAQK